VDGHHHLNSVVVQHAIYNRVVVEYAIHNRVVVCHAVHDGVGVRHAVTKRIWLRDADINANTNRHTDTVGVKHGNADMHANVIADSVCYVDFDAIAVDYRVTNSDPHVVFHNLSILHGILHYLRVVHRVVHHLGIVYSNSDIIRHTKSHGNVHTHAVANANLDLHAVADANVVFHAVADTNAVSHGDTDTNTVSHGNADCFSVCDVIATPHHQWHSARHIDANADAHGGVVYFSNWNAAFLIYPIGYSVGIIDGYQEQHRNRIIQPHRHAICIGCSVTHALCISFRN